MLNQNQYEQIQYIIDNELEYHNGLYKDLVTKIFEIWKDLTHEVYVLNNELLMHTGILEDFKLLHKNRNLTIFDFQSKLDYRISIADISSLFKGYHKTNKINFIDNMFFNEFLYDIGLKLRNIIDSKV